MAARGGDGRAPAPALAGEAEAPGGPGHGAAPSPAERQPHTFDIATPERVAAPAAAAAAGAAGRPGPAWRVAALEPGGSSRPSPPRGIIEKRKDGFRREWEQQHPFWPSLEKGGRPHSQRGRAPPKAPPPQQAGATRNMRLHADWKYSAEGRRKKIAESEVDKVGQVVEEVSSSRALSEERALAHLRKNRRMLQERESRGDLVKRYNNLGPDADSEWTATPFPRAWLIDRVFLRLTDSGSSMSSVELWEFLQALKDQVEVEAGGVWTAGPFTISDFERFVECTEQVLGWRWNRGATEDEEDEQRGPDGSSWVVLIKAQQFQDFLNSPEVWQGNCPDDDVLYSYYRGILAQVTRPRLIKELFQKLDVDRCQVLGSKPLLHFAKLYGFKGDEREWAKELEDLRARFHWGANGAAKGHLAALVSTRDPGKAAPCYFCSSMRLDYILALLEEHPPSLGDSRQVSMKPFVYPASPYTPSSVEFSPLSSRRESPRWARPPRSPGAPPRPGEPPPSGPRPPLAWPRAPPPGPAEEAASAALVDDSVDSFHQLLEGLTIPSAAELLSGGRPQSSSSRHGPRIPQRAA